VNGRHVVDDRHDRQHHDQLQQHKSELLRPATQSQHPATLAAEVGFARLRSQPLAANKKLSEVEAQSADFRELTPMQTSTCCSLAGVPPAEKFRRQIEAG
jgi:hypothetical protein